MAFGTQGICLTRSYALCQLAGSSQFWCWGRKRQQAARGLLHDRPARPQAGRLRMPRPSPAKYTASRVWRPCRMALWIVISPKIARTPYLVTASTAPSSSAATTTHVAGVGHCSSGLAAHPGAVPGAERLAGGRARARPPLGCRCRCGTPVDTEGADRDHAGNHHKGSREGMTSDDGIHLDR